MSSIWSINKFGFVEIAITPEMQAEADKRNKSFHDKCGNLGTHRTNSGRQRNTGYLAEMGVKHVFPKLEFSRDPSVDFVFNNITFDVKAQGCNVPPAPDFVGTLYEEQESRSVDFYIFTRVKNDFTKMWILGFISKDQFLRMARLVKAGEINNNFRYDQSRYEIEYGKLTKPVRFMGNRK